MAEIPLVMPKMSMTMTEGIFVAWHKQPGDEVRSGDVVAEVTTDKVDMEVESPIDGVLARLVAEPEDVIPVGEPIAFLTSDSEDLLGDLLGDSPDGGGSSDAGAGAVGEEAGDAAGAAGSAGAGSPDTGSGAAGSPDAEPVAPVDSPHVETPPTTQADPPAADAVPDVPEGGTPARPASGSSARPGSSSRSGSGSSSRPGSGSSSPPGSGSGSSERRGSGSSARPGSRPSTRPAASPSRSAPQPSSRRPADTGGGSSGNGWVASVPLARVRAAELRVDLAQVRGTGPGGVVRVSDVESAATSPRRGASDRSVDRRRAALAKRMTDSAAVPQFVVFRDLDLDELAAVRDGVSWTAVLLTAYAAVLREDPVLHARWAGERRHEHDEVVVSVAVDTPDGLLAPSLAAPDLMPLWEVDDALRALAARAREGRLSVADLTPGTTTVSNLGGMGVDAFTVLLTPPQATALSLGAVAPVPVAVPGGLGVRVRCRAGLAVDHRVADGADAARLLQRLQDRLADPGSLGLP